MEDLNGFAWEKYNAILTELENKLTGKKRVTGLEEQARGASPVIDNGSFAKKEDSITPPSYNMDPERLNNTGPLFSNGESLKTAAAVEPETANGCVQIESNMHNLIIENERLKKETNFLKAENDGINCLQEEIRRLKNEALQITREKESEICRLYATNKRLEEQAGTLRFMAQRRSRRLLEEAAQKHKSKNKIRAKTGILEWLSKPLITVGAE